MYGFRQELSCNCTHLSTGRQRIRLPDFKVATYQLVRREMWVSVSPVHNAVVERASDDDPLYILIHFPYFLRRSYNFQSGRFNTILRQYQQTLNYITLSCLPSICPLSAPIY